MPSDEGFWKTFEHLKFPHIPLRRRQRPRPPSRSHSFPGASHYSPRCRSHGPPSMQEHRKKLCSTPSFGSFQSYPGGRMEEYSPVVPRRFRSLSSGLTSRDSVSTASTPPVQQPLPPPTEPSAQPTSKPRSLLEQRRRLPPPSGMSDRPPSQYATTSPPTPSKNANATTSSHQSFPELSPDGVRRPLPIHSPSLSATSSTELENESNNLLAQLQALEDLETTRQESLSSASSSSKVTLESLAQRAEVLHSYIGSPEGLRRASTTIPGPAPLRYPSPPPISWSPRSQTPATYLRRPPTPPVRPQFSISPTYPNPPVENLLEGIRPFPFREQSPEPVIKEYRKPDWMEQGMSRTESRMGMGMRLEALKVERLVANPPMGRQEALRGPHHQYLPYLHGHRLALESLRLLREAFTSHCQSYSSYLTLLRLKRGPSPSPIDLAPIRSFLSAFATLTDFLVPFLNAVRICSAWLTRIVVIIRKRRDWGVEEVEFGRAKRGLEEAWKKVEEGKKGYREKVKEVVEGVAFAVASDEEREFAKEGQPLPTRPIIALLSTLTPVLRESTSLYNSLQSETTASLHSISSIASENAFSGRIEGWYLTSEAAKLLRGEIKDRLRVVLEKATDLRDGERVLEEQDWVLARDGGTVDQAYEE